MKSIKNAGILSMLMLCLFGNTAEAGEKWWQKVFSKEGFETNELSVTDLSGAFKQALTIGAEKVISQLGTEGGFSADEAIRIPLPKNLKKVAKVLKKIGMTEQIDDLKLKMNQAAETAVPIAKDLFIKSITDMTFEDVKTIYQGADDSATQYFKQKMTARLTENMNPIVESSLAEVGALQSLNKVMDKYQDIPFVSSVNPNLTEYVVEKGIDGVFYYLAKQEAAIRQDPAKQTTELLKKVFGQ
ncbi:DUF4197 domain-containing protein [Marinicella litoralis]|nr:DUF4197 domain-containing protein [Marinicella litoralis]